MSDTIKKSDPDVPANLIRTIRQGTSDRGNTYIGTLEIEPHEQPHISLGHFTRTSKLKGYTIELTPDPDPEDSVVAQIHAIGDIERYELILHVANYSQHRITAKVRKL